MKNTTKPTKEEMLKRFDFLRKLSSPREQDDIIIDQSIRALIEKYGGAEPDGGPTITESQLKEAIKTINFYKGTSQIDMREWLISIGVNVAGDTDEHQD